jgi:fermentation-respiration switch protein FrsA (DUF1100 family)
MVWVLGLTLLYLVLIGLLFLFENQLVYMPGSAARWTEPSGFVAEDVVLRTAGGTLLHAWWIPCEGGEGALLFCHGQMGNLSSRGGLMKRLLRLRRNRFDNLSKIECCRGPVYLAHGSRDRKIPTEHSRKLYEAARGPKRLFLMEGLGHEWPCVTDECLDDLATFLHTSMQAGSVSK